MRNKDEIFSNDDYEKLVQQSIELSKIKLEKAFEKLEKDEDFNRKIKTISDRRKYTR